jgi:hypothetical protein
MNREFSTSSLVVVIRAEAQGCLGEIGTSLLPSGRPPNDAGLLPSPPAGRGRGQGEGADEAVYGTAHLTLPVADAPGPFPLPPEGRRGAVFPNSEPADDALSIGAKQQYRNRPRFHGQPWSEAGI